MYDYVAALMYDYVAALKASGMFRAIFYKVVLF